MIRIPMRSCGAGTQMVHLVFQREKRKWLEFATVLSNIHRQNTCLHYFLCANHNGGGKHTWPHHDAALHATLFSGHGGQSFFFVFFFPSSGDNSCFEHLGCQGDWSVANNVCRGSTWHTKYDAPSTLSRHFVMILYLYMTAKWKGLLKSDMVVAAVWFKLNYYNLNSNVKRFWKVLKVGCCDTTWIKQ